MKILTALFVLLLLHACKHPLAIEGEGDIIERLVGQRGCSLEEFQANSPRCTENEVTGEDYIVSYEAIPKPGWKFVTWRGGTTCSANSVAPYCDYHVAKAGVAFMDENFPSAVLPATVAVFGQPDTWATKAEILTQQGELRSTCVIDGKIYLTGGEDEVPGASEFSEIKVEEYDPSTDTWSTKADMPTQRIGATASAVNGKCYLIGGFVEASGIEETAIAPVDEYNPKTDTWRARAPLPEVRALGGSAAVDGKIYVFGGVQVIDIEAPVLATVAIYDPATDSWTSGAAMPTPRAGLGVAAVNGFIYTVGGLNSALGLHSSDIVERYDPAQDSWTTSASMPTSRWGLALSAADGALYATGGINPVITLSTLEIYDPVSDSWSIGADMSKSRYLHSSASVDGQVYVLGGTIIPEEAEEIDDLMEQYTP